jgi:uncharacterized protein (TIRG00374 family)
MAEEKQLYDGTDENFTEGERRTGIPEKKKLKQYAFSILFMAALIAITLYVIFRDNSADEILGTLRSVDLRWVLLGFVAMFACRICQGLAIGISARCIGTKLTFWEMLQYAFVDVFYSGITPSSTGGQPMQFFYMCRDRMSISGTTLVLFTTNIAFQISLVVVALAMLIYKWSYIAATAGGVFALFAVGFLMHFGMLLLLAAVLFSENALHRLINGVVSLLARLRIIKNTEKVDKSVARYISEVKRGVELVRNNPRRFAAILLVTLVQVLSYHVVPYFVYRSFGLNSEFSFLDIVAISAVLFVSVSFMPLPGTVGAAERGFVVLFSAVYPGHVLAATLLSRFINFYMMLVLAGAVSIYIQLRKPHNIGARPALTAREKRASPR